MTFHATRTGHIENAKRLLISAERISEPEAAAMNSEEVSALVSENYVAVILQEDAMDYDEIYLIPKADFASAYVINR